MTFSSPWLLAAGAVVVLAVVIGLRRYAARRRRLADFLGGHRAAERLGRSGLQRAPVGRMVLLATAGLLLAAAGAGPEWGDGGAPSPPADPPPPTVMVAIDISASMQAQDVSPTRLARAVEVARDLLSALGDARVGLALFSGTPYVLAPPTEDHRVLEYLLDGVTPELVNIYDPGSLPSAALREATTLLATEESGPGSPTDSTMVSREESPAVPGPRSVVVIGDGEAGEPLDSVREAAGAAAEAGIRIHAVGVGTAEGGRMILPAGYTRKGDSGSGPSGPMVSRLEEETLRAIAEEGGGLYVHAAEGGGPGRIYRALGPTGSGPQGEVQGPFWRSLDPATLFIAGALVALVVESLLGLGLGSGGHRSAASRRRASHRESAVSRIGGAA